MMEVYRWCALERWDAFVIPHLHVAPHLPQVRIGDLLKTRTERVDREAWSFDRLCPITIHFGGAISRRKIPQGTNYTLPLLWARPGDVVLSKIDLKNGAVGVLEEGWDNVVVTTHFKVYTPDLGRLNPRYFRMLLQTVDFKEWLWANRSGADGRTEVKLDIFENLSIPLPALPEQDAMVQAYGLALASAEKLEAEAALVAQASQRAFEDALGVAPPPPLPDRPVFVARFKDVERWSHDGVLRSTSGQQDDTSKWPTMALGDVLQEVRHGCSRGPAKSQTTLRVLKISAVTKGLLDLTEFKYLGDSPDVRATYSLQAGDILMCRTNGTIQYVGMSALVHEDIADTVFPDKVIRLRVDKARVVPEFLWRLLQQPAVRRQIEGAARTAVGNFAIGGNDIKALTVPLPPPDVQARLARALNDAKDNTRTARESARAVREAAWAAFESALFETNRKSSE